MNKFSRSVIYEFRRPQNVDYMQRQLSELFADPSVNVFLKQNMESLIHNYVKYMADEMSLSDPFPGVTVVEQCKCYILQFIRQRADFIKRHVVAERVEHFTLTDGLPTSRFGTAQRLRSADEQLETWKMNSGRGVQGREDTHADEDMYSTGMHGAHGTHNASTGTYNGHNGNYSGHNASAGMHNGNYNGGHQESMVHSRRNNPYWGEGETSGVVVCDQSHLGTANHHDQLFGTQYMMALNSERGHTNDSFGNATAQSDERLLSRRIFRANENGVENGIPNYRKRLHNRNYERDIGETMQGRERTCQVRGHDMQSLYDRMGYVRAHSVSEPREQKLRPAMYNWDAQFK